MSFSYECLVINLVDVIMQTSPNLCKLHIMHDTKHSASTMHKYLSSNKYLGNKVHRWRYSKLIEEQNGQKVRTSGMLSP